MADTLTGTNDNAKISSVTNCYVLLGVSLPLMLLLPPPASGIMSVALLAGIIWAYNLRGKSVAGSLSHNHARWMIRTFWISSLYICIAALIAGSIISANTDASAIQNLSQALTDASATPEQIEAMVQEFLSTNVEFMTITVLICLVPVLFHAIARFYLGFRWVKAGQMVPRLTTWWVR